MKTTIATVGTPEKGLFDIRELVLAIENQQDMTAESVVVDYETTMETWKNKKKVQVRSPREFERLIYIEDDVYYFLDKGTKKHPIPKNPNAKTLRFTWGGPGSYTAKTIPRKIYSRSGGPSGVTVYRESVMHPGFPARDFSGIIKKKWDREYPRQIQRAINSVKTIP